MRKSLVFLFVLALALCMLPGLALAEEKPTFEPNPGYPTVNTVDGLGKEIVKVVCEKAPNEAKFYGLIYGGFTATPPDLKNGVYESTVTLIPSTYAEQYSDDTGIKHTAVIQGLEGRQFMVQYDFEKKMWVPKEEVKQMTIKVECSEHLPPNPGYPTVNTVDGLGKEIVKVVCEKAPNEAKFYGLIYGGFTATPPDLKNGVYESTVALIPSIYAAYYSDDTGIEHTAVIQGLEGRQFMVQYDFERKMWVPKEDVKQMTIKVTCDKHEVQTRYTVTYSDGMNGSIFSAESHTDLKKGDATPAFKGSSYRYGYRFDGWKPAWSATVTGNVTYVAQWTYVGSGGGGRYYPLSTPTPVPMAQVMPKTGDMPLWYPIARLLGIVK